MSLSPGAGNEPHPPLRRLLIRKLRRGRHHPRLGKLVAAVERRLGPLEHRLPAPVSPSLNHALERLAETAPEATDAPVFVLSAGWRSGSTLVQRLIMSRGQVLLWGEPWNRCDLTNRLAESLRPIGPDWPFSSTLFPDSVRDSRIERTWVANLYPGPADLVEAHRDLFRRLLASPAREQGYPHWGMKAVRLGAGEAAYLRLLFPRARLVLLYRNPRHAWASYRQSGLHAFRRWPECPVRTVGAFARNWADLTGGFVAQWRDLDAFLVSYEALIGDGATRCALERYLGTPLDHRALDHRVGASAPRRLSWYERRRIDAIAGPLARELGY
ncbi:MAG: sulfotransferase [Pseudomonadota bacterium]